MPRYLDEAEREQAVVSAAWRLIAREGVGALTVRKVAHEAELAPSSLRYTFPTQASIREQALKAVGGRISERTANLPDSPGGQQRARALLLELLPLDKERRLEMQVFLALGMAALTDENLKPLWGTAEATVKRVCEEAVSLAGGGSDSRLVSHLHALMDGLAFHLLVSEKNQDVARAQAVVEQFLASVRNTHS